MAAGTTKRPINLWIGWCGYEVRQSREGVGTGQGWGMGLKNCPARAQRTNAPPMHSVFQMLLLLLYGITTWQHRI